MRFELATLNLILNKSYFYLFNCLDLKKNKILTILKCIFPNMKKKFKKQEFQDYCWEE